MQLTVNLQDKADGQVVFVAGSRRSDTTWLQEIINYRRDHRILFEPFFHARVPL